MQTFSQKYTLVHFINDVSIGYQYAMTDWPLHTTLVDVFSITTTPDALLQDLSEKLSNYKAVSTRAVGEDWFGEDKSVHVTLLENTAVLQSLHENILEILGLHGVVFNSPQFTRQGFKPHSTVQKNDGLTIGDSVDISSVSLVDMFVNDDYQQRKVLGTITLAS